MKNTKNENERFSENEITIQDLPQKMSTNNYANIIYNTEDSI